MNLCLHCTRGSQVIVAEIPVEIDPYDPSYLIFPNGKKIHKKRLKTLMKKAEKMWRREVVRIFLKERSLQ